ncbi:flagellar hook-associated protein FlgL [Halodesulfovibrio aestuarii]|uniref:Flagellar hook-associated protein FlgL n=1 Tax=Halodesulfovibrio aestuarii TaxID=126333 RepID=A0ABV4JY88_9BACT
MRIATSQIYTASLKQMNTSLNNVMELQMMTSSQKKLNNPSDDPSGAALSMQLRSYSATLLTYEDNCTLGKSYLATADGALQVCSERLTSISELAEQAATETYTNVQMEDMAIELRQEMDSLFQMANTKMGEIYLFSGNDIENSAYEKSLGVTIDDSSMTHADVVSVQGSASHTVYIQMTESGTAGGTEDLDYQYSTDGGETWTTGTLLAGDTEIAAGDTSITLATGTAVTAEDGSGEGTNLYIRTAYEYEGSDDELSLAIGEDTTLGVTLAGSSVFGGIDPATGEPYPDPNLFEALGDLVAYMETGNTDGVASCIETVNDAYEHMLQQAASVGARQNTAENTATAIGITRDCSVSQISSIEDADATQLTVEMAQAEYVYEAVLSTTTSVFQLNILSYL